LLQVYVLSFLGTDHNWNSEVRISEGQRLLHISRLLPCVACWWLDTAPTHPTARRSLSIITTFSCATPSGARGPFSRRCHTTV
jgi:hypothetical protein